MKDLTISNIERQNVLNNRFAVSKVQEHLDIEGMLFEGEYRFTKKMVADFYQVDTSTIDRYLNLLTLLMRRAKQHNLGCLISALS